MIVLKWIGRIILLVIVLFAAFLLYSTVTDYKPDEKTQAITYGSVEYDGIDSTVEALIWNIGYAGLGEESDFFFDGGEMTRPARETVEKNLKGVLGVLNEYAEVDLILLQEVDSLAKRSYRINEVAKIRDYVQGFNSSFAINYNVRHVPKPFNNPLGKVVGGLLSMSKYQSIENTRYQFPGNFSWPVGLFFLDRCFLLQRFPTKNQKELVVINTHNSAYDDGKLKGMQMEYLKNILIEEYEKENYVLVGGDWNQNPPNEKMEQIKNKYPIKRTGIQVDENYLENWKWVYDKKIPTNRALNSTFAPASSAVTIIDYYLVSPNIEVEEIEAIDLDFEYSDHQPVRIKFKLN